MYRQTDDNSSRECVYIITEYVEHGDLFDIILETGKFSEPVARYYFRQIINFIEYMHNEKAYCHRDIKPENILIDSNFNIKFSDFGNSCPLEGKNKIGKLTSFEGTMGYMPPE